MPNQYDLTNNYVSDTYGRVVQIASSSFYDGYGNPIMILSGSSLHIREEITVTQQTSSYNYSLLQGAQSGSSVEIYYNGQLLNLSSYSNVGPLYTLNSDFEVYGGDILTFIYYVNNTSGSGGGSSISSSYSDYAVTASYLLGSIASASFAQNALTASYFVGSIESASYSNYAVSSSYVPIQATASYSISSSYSNKSSLADSTTSSSYSVSSSYAPPFPTSSYSLQALSASWAPGGSSISSSYSNNSSTSDSAISASYSIMASTASYYNGNVISSSYSTTSSYSTFNPYIVTIGSSISTEDTYITAGSKGYKHIGYPSTIVKTRTISGQTGSIDINIKRNGSLLGNINITSNTGSYDTSLSGWTTQLDTDDLIEFYVSGSSVYITDVTIFIDIKAR